MTRLDFQEVSNYLMEQRLEEFRVVIKFVIRMVRGIVPDLFTYFYTLMEVTIEYLVKEIDGANMIFMDNNS